MAILTVQSIVKAGLGPTYTAAAGGGDSFPNGGNEYLHVKNGGGSPVTVTIPAQKGCDEFGVTNAAHDMVVSVPATGERIIGPVSPRQFNDANGRAQVTYSGVTSVTVGAFSMGRA
jgi:hypothetical protein